MEQKAVLLVNNDLQKMTSSVPGQMNGKTVRWTALLMPGEGNPNLVAIWQHQDLAYLALWLQKISGMFTYCQAFAVGS